MSESTGWTLSCSEIHVGDSINLAFIIRMSHLTYGPAGHTAKQLTPELKFGWQWCSVRILNPQFLYDKFIGRSTAFHHYK
jgi:hypothetical protein